MKTKKVITIFLAVIMILLLAACDMDTGATSNDNDSANTKGNSNSAEIDYTDSDTEAAVIPVVKETLAESWDLEYSDFKIFETVGDYISESETSDGKTSYYYLVKTAYDDDGGNTHSAAVRAYLVTGDNTCYITYVTVDGECVYFDEEAEDWLLDIG